MNYHIMELIHLFTKQILPHNHFELKHFSALEWKEELLQIEELDQNVY